MYHNNDLIIARYFNEIYLCMNKRGQYIIKVLSANDIILSKHLYYTKTQAIRDFMIEIVDCSNLTYEEIQKEYRRIIK